MYNPTVDTQFGGLIGLLKQLPQFQHLFNVPDTTGQAVGMNAQVQPIGEQTLGVPLMGTVTQPVTPPQYAPLQYRTGGMFGSVINKVLQQIQAQRDAEAAALAPVTTQVPITAPPRTAQPTGTPSTRQQTTGVAPTRNANSGVAPQRAVTTAQPTVPNTPVQTFPNVVPNPASVQELIDNLARQQALNAVLRGGGIFPFGW